MGKKSIFFEYSIVTSSLYIENLIQKHLFAFNMIILKYIKMTMYFSLKGTLMQI